MAYCPKCGVEVEHHVDQCPLCQFPIPDISEEGQTLHIDYKYPEASNVYSAYRERIKNRIYFVLMVVLISALVVLAAVKLLYPVREDVIQYIFISVLTMFILAFFSYGFFSWGINITGFAAAVLFLNYFIAGMNDHSWFLSYAVPIVLVVYLDSLAFHYMFMHSKKRQRLSYVPIFVLMIISSICISVDGVISYNWYGQIRLTWSLIVALSCMSVGFILHSVIKYLPDQSKEKLRRKFHM